jgi:hypothetical protein
MINVLNDLGKKEPTHTIRVELILVDYYVEGK